LWLWNSLWYISTIFIFYMDYASIWVMVEESVLVYIADLVQNQHKTYTSKWAHKQLLLTSSHWTETDNNICLWKSWSWSGTSTDNMAWLNSLMTSQHPLMIIEYPTQCKCKQTKKKGKDSHSPKKHRIAINWQHINRQ
jgi:hypothetical protein